MESASGEKECFRIHLVQHNRNRFFIHRAANHKLRVAELTIGHLALSAGNEICILMEQGHEEEMSRVELYRHVVAKVEQDNVEQCCGARDRT
jgi:hypothetical protein